MSPSYQGSRPSRPRSPLMCFVHRSPFRLLSFARRFSLAREPAVSATRDPSSSPTSGRKRSASIAAQTSAGSSGFAAGPEPGSWTTLSTAQRSDSGRRSKLRSSARRPGRRTARSMSRKPPARLGAARLPLALELLGGEARVDAAEPEHPAHRRLARSSLQLLASTTSTRSRPEPLEVGLELDGVAAAGDVGGVRASASASASGRSS